MKNIGIIIPYSFYPPMGGGALRCYYVVREISKYHNLVLFISEQENMPEFKTWIQSLKNVRFILIQNSSNKKRSIFIKVRDRIKSVIHTHNFFQPANQFFLDGFGLIRREIKRYKFHAFICENLESLILFNRLIRKSHTPIIYEAHNIDSDLWYQLHLSNGIKEFINYSKFALKAEKNLSKLTDLVVAFTENDKHRLLRLNNSKNLNIEVVECGVDTDLKYPVEKKSEEIFKILFCGSLDYEPNYQGLIWLFNNIIPLFRKSGINFKIKIIGKLNNFDSYNFLEGATDIDFIGTVDSVNKYYHEADISIVPLLSGSGIRLKITESLSFGVPVVSTRLGAEGIRENNAIILADTPEEFVNGLIYLYKIGNEREKLGIDGREMVLNYYNWKTLMSKLNNHIIRVIDKE